MTPQQLLGHLFKNGSGWTSMGQLIGGLGEAAGTVHIRKKSHPTCASPHSQLVTGGEWPGRTSLGGEDRLAIASALPVLWLRSSVPGQGNLAPSSHARTGTESGSAGPEESLLTLQNGGPPAPCEAWDRPSEKHAAAVPVNHPLPSAWKELGFPSARAVQQ